MITEILESVHTPHTMCIVQPTSMKTTTDSAQSDASNIMFQELYTCNIRFRMQLRQHGFGLVGPHQCSVVSLDPLSQTNAIVLGA